MDKQEYLKTLADRTVDLEMPSGGVWKVRPISLTAYAASGRLPMHLLAELNIGKGFSEDDKAAMLETLTGKDIVKMMAIARDALFTNVVEPRITLEEEPDSLTPEMLDPEDFEFWSGWVLRGAQASTSFRTENGARTPKKRKRTG